MKQTASEDYCPTNKSPLASLPCTPNLAKSTLSCPNQVTQFLFSWCQFSDSVQIKFLFKYKMPYVALWRRTLKAHTPEFSTTIIFVSTAKGNWGLCTPKCLACFYEHLGTGFNLFLNRKVTCTGNKWWRETQRRDREGRFYRLWCWMWVPRCYTESRNWPFCSDVHIQKT